MHVHLLHFLFMFGSHITLQKEQWRLYCLMELYLGIRKVKFHHKQQPCFLIIFLSFL